MDVEKVFHMNGGIGVTSYAENSSLQKRGSDMVKHLTTGTVLEIFLSTTPKSLGIADLGCSSGHNSLTIIKDIVEAVQGTSSNMLHPTPEFRVYLNDLPTNDFNSIFKALPEFYKGFEVEKNGGGPSIFIGGYAGSFYRRLFPNNCLHFVYSSYSLHWLSRELVVGGRMVLILLGRESQDHVDRGNSFFWELLSRSFAELVSKGEVEKEKLDSYEVHFYAPSKNEIEDEVRKEGSFNVDRIEMIEIERDHDKDGRSYGTAIAMTVRAIQESMICHHFGEGILDNLFEIYGRMVDEEMAEEEIRPITFAVVLRKV
ncbi:hypothetical protein F2P56_024085 [Juglans regia]|uniref:Salicylate carboxymethyltransferase-like n=1 Tax=Juglans regia TaxID=51240 RepID=A0A833WKV9_JUGRE|nr:hypothetical protein F2P56_024085 [Juglans regia]